MPIHMSTGVAACSAQDFSWITHDSVDGVARLHIACPNATYAFNQAAPMRDTAPFRQRWDCQSPRNYSFVQEWMMYEAPVQVLHEAVVVRCGAEFNFHLVHIAARRNRAIAEPRAHVRLGPPDFASEAPWRPPDIAVLLIDCTSRFAFQYRMPRSVALLEKIGSSDEADAATVFQYFHFHALGHHTTQNIPELMSACNEAEVLGSDCRTHLSTALHAAGYVTAVLSDLSILSIVGPGVPTTEMHLAHWHHSVQFKGWLDGVRDDGDVHEYGTVGRFCYGARTAVEHMLDYVSQLQLAYTNQPTFAYMHTFVNNEPTQTGAAYLDSHLARYLAAATVAGKKDSPFIAVLGDHGLHHGQYVQTEAGAYEHDNPVLVLVVPTRHVPSDRLRHLFINQVRLTTHHDLHTTLRHIGLTPLDGDGGGGAKESLRGLRDAPWNGQAHAARARHPGLSLFEKIHEKRSCAEAGIGHRCNCPDDSIDGDDVLQQVTVDKLEAVSRHVCRYAYRHVCRLALGMRRTSQF